MKLAYILSKNFKKCKAPNYNFCYCKELIDRPDKTKITKKLISNANRCRKENNEKLSNFEKISFNANDIFNF